MKENAFSFKFEREKMVSVDNKFVSRGSERSLCVSSALSALSAALRFCGSAVKLGVSGTGEYLGKSKDTF